MFKLLVVIYKKLYCFTINTILKFNSNILKIKLFYLKTLGKINKNKYKINTFKSDQELNKVLLIFPNNEQDFKVAKYCFRNLSQNNKIEYYYLINNVYLSSFQFLGTIYGYNYISKKNKVSVNKNFFSDDIIKMNFDVIIDLNTDFILDIAMLNNNLNSNYKIGFKSKYSDLFYNIQFKIDTLEDGYDQINSMLN